MIPGLGRSLGEGKGYPLQYSGLENSMDYTVHEDCIVHGVTKSQTRLKDFHFSQSPEFTLGVSLFTLDLSQKAEKRLGGSLFVFHIPWV